MRTEAIATVPAGLGVLVIAVAVLRAPLAGRGASRELAAGLGLGLDFFLAAGLLRLSALDDLRSVAVVAAVIALRRVTTVGVGFAVRALNPSGSAAPRS